MAKWLDAKVVTRTDWNDHLFSLGFDCPDFSPFKAGQFTKIGIEEGGKVLSRPYSIVSACDQPLLEILAVPVADGLLSPQLHNKQIGDSIKIMSPATGFLVLDEVPKSRDLWLIATGTGVGPFLSILATTQVWQTYENIILVYGARFAEDVAYLSFIENCMVDYPGQFQFVPVISRETMAGALFGRIPALLDTQVLQKQVGLSLQPADSQVMLCGNPSMIEDATHCLADMGLTKHLRRTPGQISMERYW
jgi:ferredoxin--NADP+ reductase